jgi:hypothetical protein
MARTELKILTKIEFLDVYSRNTIRQFPKYEKFLLSADIRNGITELKRYAIRAGKRYHKKTTLQDLDIEVEILRSYIRESHAMKYIDDRRLGVWMEQVDEIGSIVGGWLKNQ